MERVTMRKSVLDDYDGIAEALKKIKEEEKKTENNTEQGNQESPEDSYWDYGCGLIEVTYKEQLYTPYEIMAQMAELQDYVEDLNSNPCFTPIQLNDWFIKDGRWWEYKGNCNFREIKPSGTI